MDNYPIEKGVPMPSRTSYGFGKMEVGDFKFIPDKTRANFASSLNLKSKIFVTRTMTRDGVKGVGVWRTE